MVFQEPMTSLNPVLTIGLQVMEPLIADLGMTLPARARAKELLELVGELPIRRIGSSNTHMSSPAACADAFIGSGIRSS